MSIVRVKICGLTRPGDAEEAVRLGAWALGVIFAPESPRRLSIKQAAAVLDAAGDGMRAGRMQAGDDFERVGVFVNAAADEVEQAAHACRLSAVQLHGEESPEECREIGERTGCRVIKALRVSGPDSMAGVVSFDTDYILLDTYHPGRRGGTGEIFDWNLAAELPASERSARVILSGGLDPDNIAEAVRAVMPFAVDISSGVESAPGIKDPAKLENLFDKLKDI